MSRRFTWLCGTFFTALAISGSRAEVPPLNQDDLKDMSTHIVVGKLRMVYRSVEMHGDFQHTHGLAEIAVEKVERSASRGENALLPSTRSADREKQQLSLRPMRVPQRVGWKA
jgi:hypothetical protein